LPSMKDSLAPFKGANAIPCPLGMDIESDFSRSAFSCYGIF